MPIWQPRLPVAPCELRVSHGPLRDGHTPAQNDCVSDSVLTAASAQQETTEGRVRFWLTLCGNRKDMVAGVVGVSM